MPAARARRALLFECTACGAGHPRWAGRCSQCQGWGTVEQVPDALTRPAGAASRPRAAGPARPVSEVSEESTRRVPTGLGEFDRLLGGGLVAGQVVLLAGEPGVGKSTLLLEVAHRFALGGPGVLVDPGGPDRAAGRTVLYVSGEESVEQIAVRARRIGATADTLLLADERDLGALLEHVERHDPDLIVVDSVQTVFSTEVEGRAGGMAQVQEVTQVLTRVAKSRPTPLLLVGQSTKESSVAGPRALEHLVDSVLTFDGDRHTSLRLLRATKNRYGPADEVACFEQADDGLKEVLDPSELFRGHRDAPVPGTCLTVSVEGRRALLAEVQSLVATAGTPNPRRGVTGLDSSRTAMLLAVTERSGSLRLADKDVFVATVGGARLSDPGCDLAVCLALASAAWEAAVPADVVAVGEVALSGDIRPVGMIPQRVAEAVRLGYRRVLVPPGSLKRLSGLPDGVRVVELGHVDRALAALRDIAARS